MNEKQSMIVLAILVPILYVGTYFALLKPNENDITFTLTGGRLRRAAAYGFGGTAAEVFYHPVNVLDQKLRPGYWDVRL